MNYMISKFDLLFLLNKEKFIVLNSCTKPEILKNVIGSFMKLNTHTHSYTRK